MRHSSLESVCSQFSAPFKKIKRGKLWALISIKKSLTSETFGSDHCIFLGRYNRATILDLKRVHLHQLKLS